MFSVDPAVREGIDISNVERTPLQGTHILQIIIHGIVCTKITLECRTYSSNHSDVLHIYAHAQIPHVSHMQTLVVQLSGMALGTGEVGPGF